MYNCFEGGVCDITMFIVYLESFLLQKSQRSQFVNDFVGHNFPSFNFNSGLYGHVCITRAVGINSMYTYNNMLSHDIFIVIS